MSTTRRRFLSSVAAAPFAAAPFAATAAGGRLPIRKAVEFSMLPKSLGIRERFQLAKEAGFEAIECPTTPGAAEAEEMLGASKQAGLPIHSVMNQAHWSKPLSSADPGVVEESMEGMRTSLRNAKMWGADTVLLVPAVVNPETGYAQAWERSQRQIRKLIPLAQELKVTIGIEEVWNKFLLSPIEFARYVDELESPWLKAYFDVGNDVFYGYPQDWIRTLGARIAKVHLKDFQLDRPNGRFIWRNLGEGDIDWPAVHQAFADVGYNGFMTTEINGGDAAYLKDVAARVDRFLAGHKPVS
jgi:L-ribulose-5-phosphate 3-epimerase